jgi:hypothetical protein
MLVHIFFYFSLRQLSACVADKAKRRNRTIVYNMCSSASVWLMEPVFSLPTYIVYILVDYRRPIMGKTGKEFLCHGNRRTRFRFCRIFRERAPTCESRARL